MSVPEIFVPDEDEELWDVDVDAMYPSIIVYNKLYPSHLEPIFTKVFSDILSERLEAKRTGNTLKNNTLKLSVNGLSGNLQSEYSWCYDPKMALTVRINGQLMLLMLAERLYNVGCKLINTNTDGEFILCKKAIIPKVLECCKQWEIETGLTLATDYFERFYQYAINDYLGVKKGWSETHDPKFIKTKGLFIDTPSLGKGLAPLIIPKALKEYFVNNIDPKETIYNSTEILDFCTYQKPKKEFQVFYGNTKITRINRYYMSNKGKHLYKQKFINGELTGSKIALCANSGVTIYNKFDDKDISERDINYNYYLTEVYKIISPMKFKQLSLF